MVFFSGTDDSELMNNVDNHQFYLSVITNNNGEYCAKIAYVAELENPGSSINYNKDDLSFTRVIQEREEKKKVMVVIDCDIFLETEDIPLEKFFTDRVQEIIDKPKRNVYTGFAGGSVYVNDGYRRDFEDLGERYTIPIMDVGINSSINYDLDDDDQYLMYKYQLEDIICKIFGMTANRGMSVVKLLNDFDKMSKYSFDQRMYPLNNRVTFEYWYSLATGDKMIDTCQDKVTSVIKQCIQYLDQHEKKFPFTVIRMKEILKRYLSKQLV